MPQNLDHDSLKEWFLAEKRDLPWRSTPSPYAVWVSEVMLQQTQVATVIPYFERWMRRFPTIRALAKADIDDVIKMWEGLGYYSRARSLLEGARCVCDKHGGEIPSNEEELSNIKGIGPYTAAAIRSFGFHQKAAPVDGNVLRVLTRYFSLDDDIAKQQTVKKIRQLLFEALPDQEHWVVNEALIELGATVCRKTPRCTECPLHKGCLARRQGLTGTLPMNSAKMQSVPLYREVAAIVHDDMLLIKRGEAGKIMRDLHEFPYFETGLEGMEPEALTQRIKRELGLTVRWRETLPRVSHTFTKYRVRLSPHLFVAKHQARVEGMAWMTLEQLDRLAFSSGHRKVYANVRQNEFRVRVRVRGRDRHHSNTESSVSGSDSDSDSDTKVTEKVNKATERH